MLWKNNKHREYTRFGDRFPFKGLPKTPGVYYIFNTDLSIKYVGMTKNLLTRLRLHGARSAPFREEVQEGRFSFLTVHSIPRAMELEGRMQGHHANPKVFWRKERIKREGL